MSKASDAEPTMPAPSDPVPSEVEFNLPQSPLPDGYYDEHGVPTYDAVRERIEQRSALAEGNEVLDEESEKGTDFAKKREELEEAGKDRLAQIRKSMGL